MVKPTDTNRWEVMPLNRWEHQWLRSWRWYARTLEASGRESGKGSLDAEDFAEALAQSVWHFKDWLKNDTRQQVLGNREIEVLANSDPTLGVLADLCNGSKHAAITYDPPRAEGRFRGLAWSGWGEDINHPDHIQRVQVLVSSSLWENPREVMDVAQEGLETWGAWLAEAGFDVPPAPGRPAG